MKTTYQLTNHLGNVRSTFNRNGDMLSKSDYYPFGWQKPGRQVNSGEKYRYGYQGEYSEEDEETGWNSFELRLWDSRIGRWMSTDPANQFHSPYLGMGNNPVNSIDKDGAVTEDNDWQPKMGEDGSIILEMQAGDNLQTLKKYFKGSVSDTEALMAYFSMSDGKIDLSSLGDNSNLFPSMRVFKIMRNFYQRGDPDKINCHKSTIGLVDAMNGGFRNFSDLENSNYSALTLPTIETFGAIGELGFLNYSTHYSPNIVPGNSILTYTTSGDQLNIVNHSAMSLGYDNSGNHYIWSKNGKYKWEIQTTKKVMITIEGHGDINLYNNPHLGNNNYGRPFFFVNPY